MIEKSLSEKDWKAFCRDPAYKGDPLLKALAALDKAQKQGPADMVKALDDIDRQAELLLKANKGDKALASHLAEVGKAAAQARKEAEKALKEVAGADEDDDEPVNALLDLRKLQAQLILCRRDPQRVVQFGFVDGKDKQEPVLALSPKLSGRKLFAKLQDQLGIKTGAYGAAWVEDTELMLRLAKPLGGLAKKLRPVVKACGFRVTKIIIWNEDNTPFELDEADDGGSDAVAAAAGRSGAGADEEGGVLSAQALQAQFHELLAPLSERLSAYLAAPAASRPAALQKFLTLEAFAREKSAAGNPAAALAALKALEALLPAASAPPPVERGRGEGGAGATAAFVPRLKSLLERAGTLANPALVQQIREWARGAGLAAKQADWAGAQALLAQAEQRCDDAVALAGETHPGGPSADAAKEAAREALASAAASEKEEGLAAPHADYLACRDQWEAARQQVRQQLSALEQALLAPYRKTADFGEVSSKLRKLDEVLDGFDEPLAGVLEDASASTSTQERAQHHAKAVEVLGRFRRRAADDPFIALLETNPLMRIDARQILLNSLESISGALA